MKVLAVGVGRRVLVVGIDVGRADVRCAEGQVDGGPADWRRTEGACFRRVPLPLSRACFA